MKLKRRHKIRAEVATASLNDIMFFLLLFFLIIATVVNPNVIKILLPKSDSNQTLSKKQISLTITADKTYFLDKEPVSFQQLEPKLMEATKGITDPTVVLRLDRNLTMQDLVDVMSLGSRLKIKMVLATGKT